MEKEIIIRRRYQETLAAVLEDGRLAEVYLERQSGERLCGSIFKGVVENVLPGMQAAFVDIGLEKNAFLYIDDAMPENMDGDIKPNISHLVKSGQEILVQVTKEGGGVKGARVSRRLSLAGRYAVLMPQSEHIGVSRKIEDEAKRDAIAKLAAEIRGQTACGLIVRTAAKDAAAEELRADFQSLLETWRQISQKAKVLAAPSVVYSDYSLVKRTLRDLLDNETKRVVTNDAALYEEVRELLGESRFRHSLRLVDDEALEAAYHLSTELHKGLKRRVWLKNGGYLIIDQTEAMTVIDVNTGKFIGKNDQQETIVQMNKEAALEAARQIRLRNVGGIISIDFIDMKSPLHQEEVLAVLSEELARDKVKTTMQGLTQLGLVEITRKKTRPSLSQLMEKECPYCEGKGTLASEETVALAIASELKEIAERSECKEILVRAHPLAAARLIGENGRNLRALERRLGKTVVICGQSQLAEGQYHVQALHQKTTTASHMPPVERGEIVAVEVAAIHQERPDDGVGRLDGFVVNITGGAAFLGQRVLVEIEKVFAHSAAAKVLSQ